ncbi:MAG: DUF4358 domain-containing protein [Clostridia bacterium]|nr:DUF4358 domain-containing protein [Clostridia bacterium]
MKKRVLIPVAAAVFLLAVCLCACSGKGKNEKKVSMYELKNAMASATSFGDMTYASSEDPNPEEIFENISTMDYSKVDSFFIYYATEGKGNADEIAVIQVKKADDLTEARKELENHISKRKALYSTYDKTQLTKLDASRIEVEGNCAALIVGDDVQKISNAFHSFFNQD